MSEKVNPECEHRLTQLETLLENHIPHMDKRIARLEKILWGVAAAIGSELLGLLGYLLKDKF